MRKFKYFAAFIVPILGIITFNTSGVYAFTGLFFLYVFVPVLEQFLPKNTYNLNEVEKDLAKKDVLFEYILINSVIKRVILYQPNRYILFFSIIIW